MGVTFGFSYDVTDYNTMLNIYRPGAPLYISIFEEETSPDRHRKTQLHASLNTAMLLPPPGCIVIRRACLFVRRACLFVGSFVRDAHCDFSKSKSSTFMKFGADVQR